MKIYWYVLCLAIAVILLGMTACGSKETELLFETIERNDNYSAEEGYGGRKPHVILATSRDEIEKLEGVVSQEALDRLTELDFERYFALALFRGRQATSGYDTVIERVAKQGDKIVVYAQFWEPSPDYAVFSAATSPYHIIKVHRSDGVSTQVELVLQSQVVTPTAPSH